MGRRSTKTTKSGKFINPTDQWRKSLRKKELKKNKKQRSVVREAVLRSKDPEVILQELEELEKTEAETEVEAAIEKGLEEKKRKLHSQMDRVLKYWQREDPKKAHDIKQLIVDSEGKRRRIAQVYNSYRAARSEINISDIPMPDAQLGGLLPSDIPMPDETRPEGGPGVSGGDNKGDSDEEDEEDEDDDEEEEEGALRPPGPPPGAPPLDIVPTGVIVQEYKVPKKSVRFAEGSDGSDSDSEGEGDEGGTVVTHPPPPSGFPPPSGMVPSINMIQAPPPTPLGPPPMIFSRMPPGPPPGMPPPPSRFPPSLPLGGPSGFSMVGGPPPRPLMPPNLSRPHIQSQAVITAAPVKGKPPPSLSSSKPTTDAIISAQPLLRNMQAEVTKFMPTTLRVRRDQPKSNKAKTKPGQPATVPPPRPTPNLTRGSGGMQGDAYEAFMKEMQDLL